MTTSPIIYLFVTAIFFENISNPYSVIIYNVTSKSYISSVAVMFEIVLLNVTHFLEFMCKTNVFQVKRDKCTSMNTVYAVY